MLGALTIQRLLMKMAEVDASDLHIKTGVPPVLRVAGELHRIDAPELTADETRQLLAPVIPAALRDDLRTLGGIDFSHQEGIVERFRCSIFSAGDGLHAAIRRVKPKIPDFSDLHLPPVFSHIADTVHEGLCVVCGVTGSGKSSTLAAMLQHINTTRPANIITIEDPVEYLFQPDRAIVSQREVGIDVPSFPQALRAAVRQDPDVLMIGEMRDRETMFAGIQAAETGHLVYATLHTADTMQSFARILEFFERGEHDFVRSALAAGLKAVMAQRLVPCVRPGIQRVPATEVLINTPTVAELIRDERDEDLHAAMASNAADGMHDFTSSLARLVAEEWVDVKMAERFAPNREGLRSRVRGIEVKADTLVSRVRG
ncbi:MAG: type IV pilus twitching motility protein PilT [Phycisphaerales bacterium]